MATIAKYYKYLYLLLGCRHFIVGQGHWLGAITVRLPRMMFTTLTFRVPNMEFKSVGRSVGQYNNKQLNVRQMMIL